jgi:hypothetical protein
MKKLDLMNKLRNLDVDEVYILDSDGLKLEIDSVQGDGTAALLEMGDEIEEEEEDSGDEE